MIPLFYIFMSKIMLIIPSVSLTNKKSITAQLKNLSIYVIGVTKKRNIYIVLILNY